MKNVAVVKQSKKGGHLTFSVVRRFRTVKQAEKYIGRLKNQKIVLAGYYSIDAPEPHRRVR